MIEHLSGSVGGPAYVTTYRFQAPDKVELMLKDSTTILDGELQFRRTGGGAWDNSSFPAPGFSWPSGYYREFWGDMAAPRILEAETVDGVKAEIIAFLRPDLPAWFRIWVRSSDGVVLRQEMRAEGHIMDQTYSAPNEPLTITPPG